MHIFINITVYSRGINHIQRLLDVPNGIFPRTARNTVESTATGTV